MKNQIFRVMDGGGFTLYKRDRIDEPWLPLYFVYDHVRDIILEEFRRLSSAKKFFMAMAHPNITSLLTRALKRVVERESDLDPESRNYHDSEIKSWKRLIARAEGKGK